MKALSIYKAVEKKDHLLRKGQISREEGFSLAKYDQTRARMVDRDSGLKKTKTFTLDHSGRKDLETLKSMTYGTDMC